MRVGSSGQLSAVFTAPTYGLAERSVLAAASGDGIIHELINGLASREDAEDALKIPVVPIPTGEEIAILRSGNLRTILISLFPV